MIRKFIVSRDESIYEAFPDVTVTRSGKLVCVFLECTHHRDRSYTRVVLTSSTDRGRTWSPKKPLTEPLHAEPKTGWCWDCPRISTLSDGRLAAVTNRINRGDRPGERLEQQVWIWFSGDEGETWQGPHDTPGCGIVPDQLVELRHGPHAGRRIISAHVREPDKPQPGPRQRCWISDDWGVTWTGPQIIADVPGLLLCEGSVLELPDDRLVCFMRENSALGLDGYRSISIDGGRTWDEPCPLPIPGCHRPVAGMLNSGRVMITHRFWQGGQGWRGWWAQNFFAALTDVESCVTNDRAEANVRIMPIDYDRSPNSDTGYSGWVQFDDGEIYVVNYIVDDAAKAQIRGYAFHEEEFLRPVPT
jgi:sialidase-1